METRLDDILGGERGALETFLGGMETEDAGDGAGRERYP